MTDVHVDHVEGGFTLPDAFGEPGSRHDPARMAHQHGEDGELRRGEIDRLTASRHAATDEVEGQIGHAEHGHEDLFTMRRQKDSSSSMNSGHIAQRIMPDPSLRKPKLKLKRSTSLLAALFSVA